MSEFARLPKKKKNKENTFYEKMLKVYEKALRTLVSEERNQTIRRRETILTSPTSDIGGTPAGDAIPV